MRKLFEHLPFILFLIAVVAVACAIFLPMVIWTAKEMWAIALA